jgi:hypothetical protein
MLAPRLDIVRAYLEAVNIDLSIEALEIAVVEVFVQYLTDKQIFVFYAP